MTTISLLPEKPGTKFTERLRLGIGAAFFQNNEYGLAWLALARRRTELSQAIGRAFSAIEDAEFALKRFHLDYRTGKSGLSNTEYLAQIPEREGDVTTQRQRHQALIHELAALDAEIAENERTKAGHGRYVAKIEKHLNEKLRNAELLAAVASLKAQLADGKVNGVTSGKPLARADPAAAKLNELRSMSAKLRAELAATVGAALPAEDLRQIVEHVLPKVRPSTQEADRILQGLRTPDGRYHMPEPAAFAAAVWTATAKKFGDDALIECMVELAEASRPGGLPLSERGAHVKRLRSKLADMERSAAIEADRLEAEGYAVPGDGDADVAIVIELWQRAGATS